MLWMLLEFVSALERSLFNAFERLRQLRACG